MLYTTERYPRQMENLPDDVRRMAIKITNDMLVDNDVRYHEDFIILQAIHKARLSVAQKEREKSKEYS
jgi:uncharacterized protein YdaT